MILSALDLANQAQRDASDPGASVWVMANAGSGKTHVLVNRIIRLLLNDVPPERILCLTYTRAAAAEMSNRLFDRLAKWIIYDDEQLIDLIHTQTGHAEFEPENLERARRLFTRAMETPGGLKIQTIHAFCERLLQQFPIEAGVIPGFRVMEEKEAAELLALSRIEALRSLKETGADASLAPALIRENGNRLDTLLKLLIQKRSSFDRIWSEDRHFDAFLQELQASLGLTDKETKDDLLQNILKFADRSIYIRAASILDASELKTNVTSACTIREMLNTDDPATCLALLHKLFLKKDGQPKLQKSLITKKLAEQYPDLAEALYAGQDRFIQIEDRLRRFELFEATAALLRLTREVLKFFNRSKRQRALYDYDDLIEKTISMFRESDDAAWVLYRLDGGLDHILIDEAQDTSPDQWDIIRFLTEEFFAGEGPRPETDRTIFIVGDRKQSIFSFQGADPAAFDRMYRHFEQRAHDAKQAFRRIALDASFRSGEQILKAVDRVFEVPEAAAGVQPNDGEREVHAAIRDGDAGMIEIWPSISGQKTEKRSAWEPVLDVMVQERPKIAVARQIAGKIATWLDPTNPEILRSENRPVRCGDILILVRRRTILMDALVRTLKQRGIPVAGADRLRLNDHLAIMDLKAAARFCTLPQDDLTLAAVLKSPLLARDDGKPFDDDDLIALCCNRGQASLWHILQEKVETGFPGREALAQLRTWLNRISVLPAYEFFNALLVHDDGRRKLLTRLGSEADEPIDAFMSLALDADRSDVSSMLEFLDGLENDDAEIKRDMDQGSDEVRIMTVHAAKGLESNIVILPDTCERPRKRSRPELLFAQSPAGTVLPLAKPTQAQRPNVLDDLLQGREADEGEEYNRLLYVAMTRAKDRLYVAGFHNSEKPEPNSWYDLIKRGLIEEGQSPDLIIAKTETGDVDSWRIGKSTGSGKGESIANEGPAKTDHVSAGPSELPVWAGMPHPKQSGSAAWLAPSRLHKIDGEEASAKLEPIEPPLRKGEPADHFQRGNLIHMLLQYLPDIRTEDRQTAADRIASRFTLSEDEKQTAIMEVLNILEIPALKPIFGPDSRAEVPVVATIEADGQKAGISGQIDRLVVDQDNVLIIDYKTNRPPPAKMEDVQPAYVAQMAAYRTALEKIYPEKTVRTFLLWTQGARWMEIE